MTTETAYCHDGPDHVPGTLEPFAPGVGDSQHRLCRTFDPESGHTILDYDGANNLAWRVGVPCG